MPLVAACPGCGRTTSSVFQELARDIQNWISTSMPEWRRTYSGVENLLFFNENCSMVYGDAQAVLTQMVQAVKDLGA